MHDRKKSNPLLQEDIERLCREVGGAHLLDLERQNLLSIDLTNAVLANIHRYSTWHRLWRPTRPKAVPLLGHHRWYYSRAARYSSHLYHAYITHNITRNKGWQHSHRRRLYR